MDGTPTGFWSKLDKDSDGEVLRWHPLIDHCADVAACVEALLEQKVIRTHLAQHGDSNELDRAQVERLCVLAALHDLGKHNHGFQNRSGPHPKIAAGHVAELLSLFGSDSKEAVTLAQVIDFESLSAWSQGDAGARLLIASIGHHGRPGKIGGGRTVLSLWRASEVRDPMAGARALTLETKSWYPAAWDPSSSPLPHKPEFQHAFAGLVMLADWIGSDTRFFPFSQPSDPCRIQFARTQAQKAIAEIGLDAAPARSALGATPPGFSSVCEFAPRPAQARVVELPIDPCGSISILEAETGAGKTEAAYARFMALFHAGLVDGMYFALPTRTAATQIYDRTVEAIARAFPTEDTRPTVVLAVPGYIKVDGKSAKRLPRFEVLWPDDDRERYRYRGWAAEHPKRYLAGTVVVGTIDQVLLSTLAVRHSHMRAAALSRHLLVVDEVHASDAYMNALLESVLQRHVSVGGHALLMSATLEASTRQNLLQTVGSCTTESSAAASTYPLVTHQAVGNADRLYFSADSSSSKTIDLKLLDIMEDPSSVAQRAVAAAQEGARVLVIRNTVASCRATQAELERLCLDSGVEDLLFRANEVVTAHHSRYSPEDRKALDAAIESEFGKNRPKGGLVAVATQTVQQSLDLDADLIISDLCPMDVLLQRIGRLHRHSGRVRPKGYDLATSIVLTPQQRDLGSYIAESGKARGPSGIGSVYEDLRMIECTWRTLEQNPTIKIPDQCRALVEASLNQASLVDLTKSLGGLWQQHEYEVWGKLTAQKRAASLNLANWHAQMGDQAALFPSGSDRRIGTRLGEEDRIALLPAPWTGPFGRPVAQLTIPYFWAYGIEYDAEVSILNSNSESLHIKYGQKRFVYDRLGLRPATDSD